MTRADTRTVPPRQRRSRSRAAAARGEVPRDLRGQLLAATERLLADRALEQISVADLADAAAVSRASFYIYFESKYAAVAAVAEQVTDEIYRDHWQPFFGGTESPTIENYTDHWLQTVALWNEHRVVLVAAASAWRTDPAAIDGWRALWTNYVRFNREFIAQARARGDAPEGLDAATLAASLTWMSENALYLTFTGAAPEFQDHRRLAETQAGIWFRAIFS